MDALDPLACYEALKTRDARFDGRFFTCVKTTGIYCRPVCPARLPNFKNCRFVTSAAAAQALGFRPCLRCRPECAPGSPAWRGTASAAGRALRLIAEGALDETGVDALAARTGLGARHLRRLVKRHTGASPVEIARSRRIHFAKRLIAETGLKMTEIAFASGFGSLRRFNAEMKAALGTAPSGLRRTSSPPPGLVLPLAYRGPYDWPGVLAHLAMRTVPGLERIEDGAYIRRLGSAWGGGEVRIAHDPASRNLVASIAIGRLDRLDRLVERLRAMFDLDADPQAIEGVLARDPLTARAINAAPGLRVVQSFDVFEGGLRAILGQQVTVKAAVTMLGRLVARAGGEVPDRKFILAMDFDGFGLPGGRVTALRSFANAAAPDTLARLRLDPSEAVPVLTALKGIGRWTAEYFALRSLADPDVFPAGDLVLRQMAGTMDEKALRARMEALSPWRAYAAQGLWRLAALPQHTPAARRRAAQTEGARP